MYSARATWIKLFKFIVIGLLIFLAYTLPAAFCLHVFGLYPKRAEKLVVYFSQITSAITTVWILLRPSKVNVFDFLGLVRRGMIKETMIGVILTSTMWFIAFTVKSSLGWYKVTGLNENFEPLYPFIIVVCIAISEEIVNRGFVFQTLEGHYGTKRAMIISSILFGLGHLFNFDTTPDFLTAIIFVAFISCAGLLFTAGYLVHRRLWLPIGLHFGWDMTLQTFNGSVVDRAQPIFTGVYEPSHFSLTALALTLGLTYLLVQQAKKNGNWRPKPVPEHLDPIIVTS